MRKWSDDLWKVLVEAIKAVWEGNGKIVSRVNRVPATALFVSANLTQKQVEQKLPGPVRSKLCLLYTGDQSLKHENLSELCSEIIHAARQLYKYLPSLLGLGNEITYTRLCILMSSSNAAREH